MIRILKIWLCQHTLKTVSLVRTTSQLKLPHAMLASTASCMKDRIPRGDAFRSAHMIAIVSSQKKPGVHLGWNNLATEAFSRNLNAKVRTINLKGVDCDSGCDECVKDGPGSCTSCKSGKYLSLSDSTKSYGSCVPMEASNASVFTLYVTPTLTDTYDASTIDYAQNEGY